MFSSLLQGAFIYCRQFLLPITSRPTMESCDISKIFDLQGSLLISFKSNLAKNLQ